MASLTQAFVETLHRVSGILEPRFFLWVSLGVAIDALIGDPVFRWHPVRLLGRLLTNYENLLFRAGLNGYAGGVLLLLALSATVLPGCLLFLTLAALAPASWIFDLAAGLVFWACFALRDLIAHGERIARHVAKGDLRAARSAVSMLVGRDADKMDLAACARGAVESMSENLVDGVLTPLAFGLFLGPLGAVLYKIISTMDSMVGYKTERYLRFGWCGARSDDVANYLFSRWCFLLIVGISFVLPGFSGRKAWRVGRAQHAVVPGPNSGWPEASIAGALSLRLIGPLYKNGVQVCDLWLGDPNDREGATPADVRRCYLVLVLATGLTFAAAALVACSLN